MDGTWSLAPWAYELLQAPITEYAIMRLGVFLTLRRMSLLGDALSHAILPGVALGFMFFGLSLTAMALGGVLAGLLVVGLAGLVSRLTPLREDASLAALYLTALALGVTLIAHHGTRLDVLHILFGSALGVDAAGLYLVAGASSLSLLALAGGYRGLVLESFDPQFLRALQRGSWCWQQGFLMLVVLNLVAGFQTLGTLMAVGLMMVPAVSARLWHDTLPAQLLNASAQAMVAGVAGLLLSYHLDTPSGPTIIGCAGALYAASLLVAPGFTLQLSKLRPTP